MTLAEVPKCFSALEPRERLIAKFAILGGLRPSEIFGLKWGDINETHAYIRQRVYRGVIDTPKTFRSTRKAALTAGLLEELRTWKEHSSIQSRTLGFFHRRPAKRLSAGTTSGGGKLAPTLKRVGLDWVDFHVMRRTHATLMNEIHDDPKLVANRLGHTLDVNQNVYTRASVARQKKSCRCTRISSPSNVRKSFGAFWSRL